MTDAYAVQPGKSVRSGMSDVKASRASTAGSVTIMEITIEAGPPRHTHANEDESLYVLAGSVDVECGGEHFEAGRGAFAFLPRGVPHTFSSTGGPATALLIATPGGLDDYFAELHGADPERIPEIQRRYGITRA